MVRDYSKSIMAEPIAIGNVTVKNRFMVPAVSMEFAEGGKVTDKMVRYFEERAKGGFGLVVVEAAMIDPNVMFTEHAAAMYDDSHIEGQARIADALHRHGAVAFLQLNHNGAQLAVAPGDEHKSVAPSRIPSPLIDVVPRELTVEEIHEQVERFSDAALRAKKAGYDGVEVHGAHGYLIAEFMSPYFNKRFDEYGGSLDNRMRFPLEIIAAIRKKCGDDFPIMFRISVEEFAKGGRTTEDTKVIARMLEDAGVAAIDLTSSTYGDMVMYEPPMNLPYNTLGKYAAEVRQMVDIPVATVGHVVDPRYAESMVMQGQVDLVAMGRASIADPDIPNKFFEGRSCDIRLCLSCNQGCVAAALGGFEARCMTNPSVGFEYLDETAERAAEPKRVVVVGAGPAGILAAEGAALKGHEVTLYEREAKLGGAFKAAPIPLEKTQLASLLSWHIAEIRRLGVKIVTGHEYARVDYEASRPDTLIIATGTNPSHPPIAGIDGPNVVDATDVLYGTVRTGKSVVIAGGGLIGAETAIFLTEQGCKVSIVEMRPTIAPDEEFTRRILLMRDLDERGVTLYTSAPVAEFTEEGVVATIDGARQTLSCDTVVLALGVQPERGLYEELKDQPGVTIVGGDSAPANALTAVRQGFEAGLNA